MREKSKLCATLDFLGENDLVINLKQNAASTVLHRTTHEQIPAANETSTRMLAAELFDTHR